MREQQKTCPSRSPESKARCEKELGHQGPHVGPHLKGYLGWKVSWPHTSSELTPTRARQGL